MADRNCVILAEMVIETLVDCPLEFSEGSDVVEEVRETFGCMGCPGKNSLKVESCWRRALRLAGVEVPEAASDR